MDTTKMKGLIGLGAQRNELALRERIVRLGLAYQVVESNSLLNQLEGGSSPTSIYLVQRVSEQREKAAKTLLEQPLFFRERLI